MKFVEHYREVKERRGLRARDWARYLMLSGISSFEKYTGSEAIFKTPRVQFLYLHHVFKDEEARLDTLLQKLSKHHKMHVCHHTYHSSMKGETNQSNTPKFGK